MGLKLTVLILALGLAACESAEAKKAREAAEAKIAADAAFVAAVKDSAARTLRDPSSAQFRDLRLGTTPKGEPVLCGEVNGKNAYGAYAGFTAFFFSAREGKMDGLVSEDGRSLEQASVCRSYLLRAAPHGMADFVEKLGRGRVIEDNDCIDGGVAAFYLMHRESCSATHPYPPVE